MGGERKNRQDGGATLAVLSYRSVGALVRYYHVELGTAFLLCAAAFAAAALLALALPETKGKQLE